jgi:hypothetical protein
VYDRLPRLLLVPPTFSLTEAHRLSQNLAITVKYALEVLRNFGFIDPVVDGSLRLNYEKGVSNKEAFNALRYAAEGYTAIRKLDLAEECRDAMRKIDMVLAGSDERV